MGIYDAQTRLAICTPIPAIDVKGHVDAEGKPFKRLAPVTVEWHRARQALLLPFGWNSQEFGADGMEVGDARNHAVQKALDLSCDFIFFLDWDVLVPPKALHRLVYDAQNHPDVDVFSGVYCVKLEPPCPLIFKGFGTGVFWDWTPGELLIDGITGCGMGCALIRTSLFTKLSHTPDNPWFKTVNELATVNGQEGSVFVTEDIWMLKRAVNEVGAKICVDTGILCSHIDNNTGIQYVLPEDSLPAQRLKAKLAEVKQ